MDDGVPGPGRRVRRLRHLRSRVPTHVVLLDTVAGPTPLAARQGPVSRPVEPAPAWQPLGEVTANRSSRPRVAVGQPVQVANQRATERLAGLAVDGHRWPPRSISPCQKPARPDGRGPIRRLIARDATTRLTRLRPRSTPSRRSAAGSAPLRARRSAGVAPWTNDRHPPPQEIATEQGKLPPVAPPSSKRTEKVAIVGGGPAGMSAAYYLAASATESRLRGDAVPGGMMAIGILSTASRAPCCAGDRPHRRLGWISSSTAPWDATSRWPIWRRSTTPSSWRPERRAAESGRAGDGCRA